MFFGIFFRYLSTVLHHGTVIIAIPLVYMFSIHSEVIAYSRKRTLHKCRRIFLDVFIIPHNQVNYSIG